MNKKVTPAGIPVFAFTAYSGTGKTTFLEKLIACLSDSKLRVAVIKHDAHEFKLPLDQEDKDTWRMARAGADCVGISNSGRAALLNYRSVSLEEMLAGIENADVILLEGYHDSGYPTFSLNRAETGKGYRIPHEKTIALISDVKPEEEEGTETDKPWFHLEDALGVAEFICSEMKIE